MDRKSIIFILGLTLIFFIMHQWFDYGTGVSRKVLEQPQTAVVIKDTSKGPAPLPKSQFNKYNLVKLYSDISLREFVSYGVFQTETVVTLAWKDHLPDELFMRFDQDGTVSVRRVQMRVQPERKGDPTLYSFYPLSKVEVPWIPDEGTFPVVLLSFDGDKVFAVNGETDSGEEITLDANPIENSLVLFSYEGKNTPYAYFDKENKELNYLDHVSHFGDYSIQVYPEKKEVAEERKKQNFYVLENEFQQLVFSDLNGDITEINLPFVSEKNPTSVVRPIAFDRIILENYTDNAKFPLYPYQTAASGNKKIDPKLGGYYPLLRRNLIGAASDISTIIPPYYHGFNIFEDEANPDAKPYQLKRFEKDLIEFEFSDGNRRITKTFSFPKAGLEAPYVVDLSVKVEGTAKGLLMNMGVPEVELISGNFKPSLRYRLFQGQKVKMVDIKPPKNPKVFSQTTPDWILNGNGFFGVILDPLTKIGSGFSVHPISGELSPTRLTVIDAEYDRFRANKYPGYGFHIPLPSKQATSKFRIFAGPLDKKVLAQVDQTYTNAKTGYNPDYAAAQSYQGWFASISVPFAKFLAILMNFFYKITQSWGVSIILLTVALRLMLFPLNNWSMKSMARVKELAPKVKELEEKYKKDPQRAKLETMQLYRKEKVNPLMGGCFPILIQFPFLIGMFSLLSSSFALRGAVFIPGWINNLTAPDVLFSWSYPIPFIGNSFHLLPIILGACMFLQNKVTTSMSKASGQADDKSKQMGFSSNLMTIVFTVMFYSFPSGLNIYWISSTLLGILQQWMINKKMIAARGK